MHTISVITISRIKVNMFLTTFNYFLSYSAVVVSFISSRASLLQLKMSFPKSRQSTFHARVQEELICGVCLDFLSEPKLLSCAHSFCCSCLQRVLKKASKSSFELECPSCRQVTPLKSGNVDELNANYNLKRLVDIVSEEEKKKARDVIKRRYSTRCSVRQSPQASKLICKLHSKQLEYFCVDCNSMICPKCIKSDHLTHRFEDIDDVFPSMLGTLRNAIQPACEVSSSSCTSMQIPLIG